MIYCRKCVTPNTRPNGKFKVMSSGTETYTPIIGVSQQVNPFTGQLTLDLVEGAPMTVSGFRLVDSRASYGLGLETFLLGFPVHFDWSYRTLFNKAWEDYLFAPEGGSAAFRKARFTAWIGYDF